MNEYIESFFPVLRWQYELVLGVANCYRNSISADMLAAWNTDYPDCKERLDGYRYNVDKAVLTACADLDASEADRLYYAWEQIRRPNADYGETEASMIQVLAPVFEERGLRPEKYFTRQIAA
jgi:hypothetical protein